MARCQVYLIPAPIGDQLSDLSFAGVKAMERLEHLFVEADDAFVTRMRARKLITPQHRLYTLDDPPGCVARAVALVAQGTSFGVLASSGLPGFVDPGHEIVARLLEDHLHEVELVPVGMSSALDAALALSGSDIQQFVFAGHAPEYYRVDAGVLATGLPLIYFARGPSVRQLLKELADHHPAVHRVLLLKDIRKKSRQTVTVLRSASPPQGLEEDAGADYVVVVLPP